MQAQITSDLCDLFSQRRSLSLVTVFLLFTKTASLLSHPVELFVTHTQLNRVDLSTPEHIFYMLMLFKIFCREEGL